MSLFTRKPKMGVEEFLRNFYDTVLHAVVAGIDAPGSYRETVIRSISESDPSFSKVDSAAFEREFTAAQLELLGLALANRFKRDVFKRDKYWLAEVAFTKKYLQEAGRSDLWEAMLAYNQAIASSPSYVSAGKRMHRWNVGMSNEFRFAFAKKWMAVGVDPDSVGRAASRIWTARTAEGIVPMLLADTMLKRLEVPLSTQGRQRLIAVLYGVYTGSKEELAFVALSVA